MSYRGKRPGSLETDIERSREEGNWKRVIELANQLKDRPDKDKQNEALGWFLIGEGKLEEHLEEFPPNIDCVYSLESSKDSKSKLREAKSCLEKTVGEDAVKIGVHLDSWILLAKLHFAMGNFSESLRYYDKSKLETLEEKSLPPRSLKIIAEAFAIKGICIEKTALQISNKHKLLEREHKITRCFEISGDLTLLYLQEMDRLSRRVYTQSTLSMQSVGTTGTSSSPVPSHVEHKLGPILELALLKAPQLYIKAGEIQKAISRFRAMLSAEETRSTSSVRLGLAKQLAETLMHSISESKYTAPDSESPRRVNSRQSLAIGESPWKPRKYASSNQFIPTNKQEEIVLLLLLCEVMVSKHVPLNQNPEYDEHRANTMMGAMSVFNLMNLALARYGYYRTLVEMFERSLRYAPNEDHIWSQFALALACEGRFLRCVVVLKEVAKMDVEDASCCLLAARVCYERLNLLAEGIHWAEKGLEREEDYPQDLRSRAHLYIGIGHYLKATEVETQEARQAFSQSALQHLQMSIDIDPGDHLAHFYLGLHLASLRRLNEAYVHANKALQLNPEHLQSLHLTALILSAKGELEESLRLVEHALSEYPEFIPLLALRARLEEETLGAEVALETARYMFNILRDLGEVSVTSNDSGIGLEGETKSIVASYSHWDTLSDKDSVSLQAQSVAASQVERTLSEVASSLSTTGIPKYNNQEAAYNQIRIWLLTAELYLKLDQVDAAQKCCNEARQLYPLSYLILYLRGLIHQHCAEWEAAKICFEDSLSINPNHVYSLQALGITHLHLGSPRLAEMSLRSAIRLQPHDNVSWTYLGLVLETLEGESEVAANCFAAALETKDTAPLLPFSTISLAFD